MKFPFPSFWIACILLLVSLQSQSQLDSATNKKWADILTQYQKGQLSDSIYMDSVKNLAVLSATDLGLKEKLNMFQKIAWDNPAYQNRRIWYYLTLYNNCMYTYRAGASFYYAEKVEEERKKVKPYWNGLQVFMATLFAYGRSKSGYPKCIEEYRRILPYLKEIPQKLITDSLPIRLINNATALFPDIVDFHVQLGDTAGALAACNVSDNICNSLHVQTHQYNKDVMKRPYYNCFLTQYFKQKILGRFDNAKKMLDSANSIATSQHTTSDFVWWQVIQGDMYLNYFNFFIEQKQTDSAAYYLQRIRESQDSGFANHGDGTMYLYNYGLLKAGEGDYKTAYESILGAYKKNDSVIGIKTADINNNMYAEVVAEEKSEELKKAKIIEQKRNILIAAISAISLIIILFLYLQMRKKERLSKEQIYKLDYASKMQIIELEERNLLTKH